MKDNNRTITNLRNTLNGRIYVLLKDDKTCTRFLQDAENEGYRFGKIKPTESNNPDIVSIESSNQLSHVGYIGHIAFQCGGSVGGNMIRVDYEKYINGDKDYFIGVIPKITSTEVTGKFYGTVPVIGKSHKEAVEYLTENLPNCASPEDEDNLYQKTETTFNVIIPN